MLIPFYNYACHQNFDKVKLAQMLTKHEFAWYMHISMPPPQNSHTNHHSFPFKEMPSSLGLAQFGMLIFFSLAICLHAYQEEYTARLDFLWKEQVRINNPPWFNQNCSWNEAFFLFVAISNRNNFTRSVLVFN